jgi:hypothetical protein
MRVNHEFVTSFRETAFNRDRPIVTSNLLVWAWLQHVDVCITDFWRHTWQLFGKLKHVHPELPVRETDQITDTRFTI